MVIDVERDADSMDIESTVPAGSGRRIALVDYGIGTSTGAVTFNSPLQAETPTAVRGRVFAAFDLLWQLGRLASLALGGVLADTTGITAVYVVGAVLLVAAAVIGWSAARAATLL